MKSPLLITQAASDAAAGDVITEALVRRLALMLSLDEKSFDSRKPTDVCGVDSLVAVDLRNWIAKEMGAKITIFELMGGASLGAIGDLVGSKSVYRRVDSVWRRGVIYESELG